MVLTNVRECVDADFTVRYTLAGHPGRPIERDLNPTEPPVSPRH